MDIAVVDSLLVLGSVYAHIIHRSCLGKFLEMSRLFHWWVECGKKG